MPEYYYSLTIPISPVETLEARAREYFHKWGPRLWEIFEQEYDKEVALAKVGDELSRKINKENAEAESQLKKDSEVAKIKSKLEETKNGLATFYRVMLNAMSRLPDAEGAHFEILTPEMAYDNDFTGGIYSPPPKDTIYVAASSYYTGKVQSVDEWLRLLAHEAAHRPNPNGHDVAFRIRERRNLEILRRLSIDELLK